MLSLNWRSCDIKGFYAKPYRTLITVRQFLDLCEVLYSSPLGTVGDRYCACSYSVPIEGSICTNCYRGQAQKHIHKFVALKSITSTPWFRSRDLASSSRCYLRLLLRLWFLRRRRFPRRIWISPTVRPWLRRMRMLRLWSAIPLIAPTAGAGVIASPTIMASPTITNCTIIASPTVANTTGTKHTSSCHEFARCESAVPCSVTSEETFSLLASCVRHLQSFIC